MIDRDFVNDAKAYYKEFYNLQSRIKNLLEFSENMIRGYEAQEEEK